MIRFIIEIVSSERDRNGNCYHFAEITRTSDRNRIKTEIDSPSSIAGYARKADLKWDETYHIEKVIPKREWQRMSQYITRRLEDLEPFFRGTLKGEYNSK